MDTNSKLMREIQTGINNFAMFQRYPFFRWPAWVEGNSSFSHGVLQNKTHNQWVCFSNMHSLHEIRIDDTGMVTSSYGGWAMEFWVFHGNKIYRSQNSFFSCSVDKKPASSTVAITWKEKPFTLKAEFTGIRTLTEEALCKIELQLSDSAQNVNLITVIRPYNNNKLGSISSLGFESENGTVRIDGKALIKCETDIDTVLTGSGSNGDIIPALKENSYSIKSSDGMATMGLVVNAKKKSATTILRISLDAVDLAATGLNISFEDLMKEFEQFASARAADGIKLSTPDKQFGNWFLSAKASLMSLSEADFFDLGTDGNIFNFKNAFFYARALHRMNRFAEAAKCIDKMREHLVYKEKKPTFINTINCCYFISAVVDSFVHTRDMEYLNNEFAFVLEVGKNILKYTSQLKSYTDVKENSLPVCVLAKPLCYDFALMASAYSSLAYFARCMGIFGEEKKFDAESTRFQQMIASNENYLEDEFFFLMILANYPFNLQLCRDKASEALRNAKGYFLDSLIKIKSAGIDVLSSIMIDHNILLESPSEAAEIFNEVSKISGNRYSLPEFLDLREKKGIFGSGASKVCMGEIFSFLRSLIFIDSPERLSIFPKPDKSWFESGKEFSIEDAPSRFGNINFKFSATPNEITFYFDVLPKFVPPEISITFPFPVKIQKTDDFFFKKSVGNTYYINGWPSQVKFFRGSSAS